MSKTGRNTFTRLSADWTRESQARKSSATSSPAEMSADVLRSFSSALKTCLASSFSLEVTTWTAAVKASISASGSCFSLVEDIS